MQAPPAQPTSAQNRTHCRGELLGRRSPARSRTASATPPSQKPGLLAPQRKRSSAQPDPVYEANTEDTVRYGLCAFCAHLSRIPKCARTKCTGGHWKAEKRAG